MKKIIVVFMAVVVLVSTLCLFAFAADYHITTTETSISDLDDHIQDGVEYAILMIDFSNNSSRLPMPSNQSELDSNIAKYNAFNYYYDIDNISVYDKLYLVPIIDDRIYFVDFILDNDLLLYNADYIDGPLVDVVLPEGASTSAKVAFQSSLCISCLGVQGSEDDYSISPGLSNVSVTFTHRTPTGNGSNNYLACHEFSDFNTFSLEYNSEYLFVNKQSMDNFDSYDYYFDFSTDVPTVVFDTVYRDTTETEDNYASFKTTGSSSNLSITDYSFNSDNIDRFVNGSIEHYVLRPNFYKMLKEHIFSNNLYKNSVYKVYSYNEINPLIPTFTNTLVSSIGSFVSGIGSSFSSAFSALFLTESGGLNVLAIFLLVVAGVSLGYGVIRWITGLFRKEK